MHLREWQFNFWFKPQKVKLELISKLCFCPLYTTALGLVEHWNCWVFYVKAKLKNCPRIFYILSSIQSLDHISSNLLGTERYFCIHLMKGNIATMRYILKTSNIDELTPNFEQIHAADNLTTSFLLKDKPIFKKLILHSLPMQSKLSIINNLLFSGLCVASIK